MKNTDFNVTFIGFGNMGSAIVRGISKENLFSEINVVESDNSKFDNFGNPKIKFMTSINSEIKKSHFIWLCIKPQSFREVLLELKKYINSEQVIISIMAGITINQINKYSNHDRTVRVMPNTPAQVSKGISVWTYKNNLEKSENEIIQQTLNSFGKSIFVEDETKINIATALSGSGPGFIFRILESFILAGQKAGLEKNVSEKLAIETLIGSAELINSTNSKPKELREAVTSQGGTTEAGLDFLNQNKIDQLITDTIITAVNRGRQLSEESDD